MKHYNFETTDQFEDLFRGESPEITDAMVESISEAHSFQKENADMFSITFGDMDIAYEITLPRPQWANALEKCLDNYHTWESSDKAIDTYLLLKEVKEWEETE